MGQNFDDYPGLQPMGSWANTYAQHCSFRPLHFIEFSIFLESQFFGFFFLCFWHVCLKFGMKLLLFVNVFIAFLFLSHKHLGENLSKNSQQHTHPQWIENLFEGVFLSVTLLTYASKDSRVSDPTCAIAPALLRSLVN